MVNVIDHFYEKVTEKQLSKKELMDIFAELKKTHSFGNNSYSRFDLYMAMAESDAADDEVVKTAAHMNTEGWDDYNSTFHIINLGSKKLFDEIWDHGFEGDKPFKAWESKHTSKKQMEEIYPHLMTKNNPDTDKNWLAERRALFFKHPNAPAGILNRNSNSPENLVAMASNPNITKTKKAFEAVCTMAKRYSLRADNDDVLEALLTNKHLDWKTVAKGVDIVKQLNTALGSIPFFSDKRIELYMNFCKHPDAPEELKSKLYEKTGDEDFLPKTARDVFLF